MPQTRQGSAKAMANKCPCGLPDSGKMVECERCLIYHHYSCAEVNDSIADDDRHFVCTACSQLPVCTRSSRSRRSSTSSTRAARAALELERLEEEKKLHSRQLADEEEQQKVQREKAFKLEQEYISKKYNVLLSQLEGQSDAGSVRTRPSSCGARRIVDWLQDQPVPTVTTSTGNMQPTTGQQSRTGTIPKVIPPVLTIDNDRVTDRNLQPQAVTFTVAQVVSDVAITTVPTPIVSATAANHSISPPPTANDLTQDYLDLQQRMERLQLKLREPIGLPVPPITNTPTPPSQSPPVPQLAVPSLQWQAPLLQEQQCLLVPPASAQSQGGSEELFD